MTTPVKHADYAAQMIARLAAVESPRRPNPAFTAWMRTPEERRRREIRAQTDLIARHRERRSNS